MLKESDKNSAIINSLSTSQVLLAIIYLKEATEEHIVKLARIKHASVKKVLIRLERADLVTVKLKTRKCFYSVKWDKLLPFILHEQAQWLWDFEKHMYRVFPKESVVGPEELKLLVVKLSNNAYLKSLYEKYISSYQELILDLGIKKSLYELLVSDFFETTLPRYYHQLESRLKIERANEEYNQFKKFIDIACQISNAVHTMEGSAFSETIRFIPSILEESIISFLERQNLEIRRHVRANGFEYDALVKTKNRTFAIEVKAYERSPIPARIIQSLATKSKFVDGIIVISISGFTLEAIEAARRHNVRLVTLEEINELIYELKSGVLSVKWQIVKPVSITASLKRFKYDFKRALDSARSAKTNEEKKKSLEDLAETLIKPIDGLTVLGRNTRSSAEEIDITVKNESAEVFWARLGSPILIECKHWSLPISSKEIRDFFGKLESLGIATGILITLKGVTGDEHKDAKLLIREHRQKGKYIIVLDESDLVDIADGVDPSDKINERYYDIFRT